MGFAMLLIGRLETAGAFVSSLFYKLPAVEDYFAVLDARSQVPEPATHGSCGRRAARCGSRTSASAIPAACRCLSDVTFTAQPGMSVALVGHTGAGKTTTMTLLQRLWDPTAGRITIDGQDLRDVTLDSLRPVDRRRVPGKPAVQPLDPRQPADRQARTRPTRRWSGPAAWPMRTSSSCGSRRATTR